jgi:V8-like Glu-specific endopeptidase
MKKTTFATRSVSLEFEIEELRKNAIEKAFLQILSSIRNEIKGLGPNCFISHAWKGNDPGEESGFDLFAVKFRNYLLEAGIHAFYDETPLREGMHTVPFMKQVGGAKFIAALLTVDYKQKSELSHTGTYQEVKKIEERLGYDEEFYIPILLSGEEGDSIPSCLNPMGRSYEDFRNLYGIYSKIFKLLKEKFFHNLTSIDIDSKAKLFKGLEDEYKQGMKDGDLIEVWKVESEANRKKVLEEVAEREKLHNKVISEQLQEASSSLIKSISEQAQKLEEGQEATDNKGGQLTSEDNCQTLLCLLKKNFTPPEFVATIMAQGDFLTTSPNMSSELTPQKLLRIDSTTTLRVSDDGRLQIIPGDEEIDEKILGRALNKDGRVRVFQTGEWPYRVHGHLIMTFASGNQYVGSGTMVGPSHVLTAGHNLYSHSRGEGWATKVIFIPAQNEEMAPWGEAEGMALLSLKGWVNNADPRLSMPYDMGMIILDKEIGNWTGWLGVFSGPDELLKPLTVNVTGYPGDKGEPSHWSTQMWTMGHTVKSIDEDKLYYDIDTYQGQSGSALWTEYKDRYYIVGVHTYGEGIEGQGNSATRITKGKFSRILDWLNGYYGSLTNPREFNAVTTLPTTSPPYNKSNKLAKNARGNHSFIQTLANVPSKGVSLPKSAMPSKLVSEDSVLVEPDITTLRQELTEFQFLETLRKIHKLIKNGPSCFISYAWGKPEHEKLVHKIAAHLKEAGINVLLDIWDNKAGTRIARFTERIDQSDFVILFGSKQLMKKYSNEESGAVLNIEIDQTIEKFRKKPGTIVPVLLDGTKETSFPPALGTIVYIDFKKPETYYPKVYELIGGLCPNEDLSSFVREFTSQRNYLYSEKASFEDLLKSKREIEEKERALTSKVIDNMKNAYKEQLNKNYANRISYYELSNE